MKNNFPNGLKNIHLLNTVTKFSKNKIKHRNGTNKIHTGIF